MLRSTRCATDARTEGCDACASSSPPPPPSSFARSCGPPPHHPTRTYIFHGESPTFATIISVAAALVRATQARQVVLILPSSRGDRKLRSVYAYTRLRISFTRDNPHSSVPRILIETVTQWCGFFFLDAIKGE